MAFMSVSPMLALERLEKDLGGEVVGLSALLHPSKQVLVHPGDAVERDSEEDQAHVKKNVQSFLENKQKEPFVFERNDVIHQKKTIKKKLPKKGQKKKKPAQQHVPTAEELKLARGVSGLPFDQTPALVGAKRGHIECPEENVDDLAYWNNPQGIRDQEFATYFKDPPGRYLTFEPDPGGWNNIRMSMEVIFVLAAATGRTLVLPPKAPFYRLGDGTEHARSFANFFPLDDDNFKRIVNVITMEEFLMQQGSRLLQLNQTAIDELRPAADMCLHQPKEKDKRSCERLFPILRENGLQPKLKDSNHCLVFDNDVFEKGGNLTAEKQERVDQFCGVRMG